MPFRDPATGKVFNTIREAVENYRCPGPCAECPLGQKVGGFNGCDNGKWFDDHPIETARLMGYEVIDDKEVNMDKQDSQTGLYIKYDVKKVETGETVNNCFVLRPDRDPAAVTALRAYARVTPNKALADDIIAWVGAEPADKPRLEELEGLGPSPTRETEGPVVDVGAGSKPARPRLAELLGVEVGERFCVKDHSDDSVIGPFFINSDGFMVWENDPDATSDDDIYIAINHPESIVRATLTEPEIATMRALGAKWVSRNIDDDYDDVSLWSERPERVEKTFFGSEADIANRWIAQIATELFPSVKPGDCIGVEEIENAERR